jgi:hypothetical protein
MEMKKKEYVHDIDVQRRVGELLVNATTITILDDRGGSGMWIVTHETASTDAEEAMIGYWGERCDDYDGCCIACHAWKHFDETGEIAK